jgi:hypothetical protein
MREIIYIHLFLLLTSLTLAFNVYGQETQTLKEKNAKEILKIALEDTTIHNVINVHTSIIKDKTTAIEVAEPILFSTYGKKNITRQRPYETYFIDNYWIINGILPKGYRGGTFLIIIDSRDNRIVRLTHGK